jgi:hypothetical protein
MHNRIITVIVIAAIGLAACETGKIPVIVTEEYGFALPIYVPDSKYYGSESARVNNEGLTIRSSYRTSDGVTHIVLSGTIDNGIPSGLLYSNMDDLGQGANSRVGNFGIDNTGNYTGLGDFPFGMLNNGTSSTGEYWGSESAQVYAVGSPDFSAEWVMGAPYTAVVITGLVNAPAKDQTINITETNESLRLYSVSYRNRDGPSTPFSYDKQGKLQKRSHFSYDPNSFNPVHSDPFPRGGYMILVSKKAYPQTAFLEIEYPGGEKKSIEIDYSEVTMREVPLARIEFQSPTPAPSFAGTYSLEIPEPVFDETTGDYSYTVSYEGTDVYAGTLSSYPLYLRPLYWSPGASESSSVDQYQVDPRVVTTNMIHKINTVVNLTDAGGEPVSGDKLTMEWDDDAQAIKLSAKDSGLSGDVTITAELRKPAEGGTRSVTVKIIMLSSIIP